MLRFWAAGGRSFKSQVLRLPNESFKTAWFGTEINTQILIEKAPSYQHMG